MIEIELNKIKKSYGLNNILNGLTFEVKTGERIALIGPNGAGKSTVLKIINGKETIDYGKINIRKNATIEMLNQIYDNEKEHLTVEEFLNKSFEEYTSLEKRLQKLEQEMSQNLNQKELEKTIAKYGNLQEQYIAIGGYETKEKFNKICSGFKFTEKMLNQNYNNLSGGEKTIVNLAAILLKNPSILLLDEPTNHLDIERLEWIENFLINYNGTILMVSHDRYFLDKVATKTILLENGKEKIYFGNYSYFLEEDERRTLAEFEIYKNQQKQIEKMKESIKTLRKFGEIAKNEMFYKRAKSIEKRLAKMEVIEKVNLNEKSITLKFESKNRSGKDVLKLINVSKSFDKKELFKNINLEIFYGEKICLIGKNGTGKSTLIKMILGQEKDFSGEIKIGSSVKIGYIPQEIKFENEKETILDFFLKCYDGNETMARTKLAKYMFCGEHVFKKVGTLSGGEKVRLKLLELMQKDINFLILDEPTNHIDISTREVLEETLKNFNGTILFVSHDRYFINSISTKILKIEKREMGTFLISQKWEKGTESFY